MQNHISAPQAYRMDIAYRGTNFSGFQSQVDRNAVQDHIEKALATYFRQPFRIKGSSRTDAGVHAEQQVAIFRTPLTFISDQLIYGLNSILPNDIVIKKVQAVGDDFDPIRNAKAKAYRYQLWLHKSQHPFIRDYVWSVRGRLDVKLIEQVYTVLIGEHDFTSFCNRDSDAKTKTRKINEIVMDVRGPLVTFWFVGEGFLKQMIRIIMGTYIDIALGRIAPERLPDILAAKDRCAAGQTAPACGLSLVDVFYEQVPSVKELMERSAKGYGLIIS